MNEAKDLFVGTIVSPLFCPIFDGKTCALIEILLKLFKIVDKKYGIYTMFTHNQVAINCLESNIQNLHTE